MIDYILGGLIVGAMIYVTIRLIRKRKQGGCAGCPGCGTCSACQTDHASGKR